MRSDTLGINAPIVFENGKYFYEDNDYTFFANTNYILKKLIDFQVYLIEYHFELNINLNYLLLLQTLSKITDIVLPAKIIGQLHEIVNDKDLKKNDNVSSSISDEADLKELNLMLENLKSKSEWYKEMTKIVKSFSDEPL